jgi:hypothetical protein
MRSANRFVVWVMCLGVCGGCKKGDADSGGTLGQQGRVEFSYQQGCFFGCPLEQPLLVGTRQTINVDDAGDTAGIAVSSSKPSVAEFVLERACFCERSDHSGGRLDIAEDAHCDGIWQKHCDNSILVQANAAGEAKLELRGKKDELIDEVPVIVHEAARIVLEAVYPDKLGPQSAKSLELAAGSKLELNATLYDDMGRKLLAPEGVSWSVDDDKVAIVTAWLIGSGKSVSAGLGIEIDAKAEGMTSLTVSVPGQDKSIDVTVTAK